MVATHESFVGVHFAEDLLASNRLSPGRRFVDAMVVCIGLPSGWHPVVLGFQPVGDVVASDRVSQGPQLGSHHVCVR